VNSNLEIRLEDISIKEEKKKAMREGLKYSQVATNTCSLYAIMSVSILEGRAMQRGRVRFFRRKF
jgi:hypothetical protein